MFSGAVEHSLRQAVGKLYNRRRRAVVLPKVFEHAAAVEDFFGHADEHRHPRSPESIDGLLRIADNQKLAAGESRFIGRISGEQSNDFGLDLVGVLKLIDQDST